MNGLDYFERRNMFPRVLMISTGHLTGRTARFLRDHDAADWPILGGHFGDVGFMLWVDEGRHGIAPHLPADLWDVFDYADTHDASIVIFQDTGVIVPDLPTYREEEAFDADQYLERPRQSCIQLEAEATEMSVRILSRDKEFELTPAYFVKELRKATESVRHYATTGSLAAMPYHRLAHLRDLASGYRIFAEIQPTEYRTFTSAISQVVQDITTTVEAIPNSAMGVLGHNRRALEDVQFHLGENHKVR